MDAILWLFAIVIVGALVMVCLIGLALLVGAPLALVLPWLAQAVDAMRGRRD